MPLVNQQPSDLTKALVEDFKTFRGGFLTSFAQVEFMFGRLISQLTKSKSIGFQAVKLPYRIESRIKAIIGTFESEAILQPYSPQATRLATRMEEKIELRNFLSHGFVKYYAEEQTWVIRMFRPLGDDPWHEDKLQLHISDVPPLMSSMSLLTQEAFEFIRGLNDKFALEF